MESDTKDGERYEGLGACDSVNSPLHKCEQTIEAIRTYQSAFEVHQGPEVSLDLQRQQLEIAPARRQSTLVYNQPGKSEGNLAYQLIYFFLG